MRTYISIFVLALIQLCISSEICIDGSIPLCSDGTKPKCGAIHEQENPACPKACDPHHNNCHATAPTCIFPDPKVTGPRGACACRPGYKATGHANNDAVNQWRLPIESHEHRVWVAEGVKCDTLCDVSTGVDSCLEVSLIAAQCIGTGATGRNASQQNMPAYQGGYGNYSRSLTATKTGYAYDASTEPTDAAQYTPEDLEGDTIDDPADEAYTGDIEEPEDDLSLEEDASDETPSTSEDDPIEASGIPPEGDDEHEETDTDTDEPLEYPTKDSNEEVDADTKSTPKDSEEDHPIDIDGTFTETDEPEVPDSSSGPGVNDEGDVDLPATDTLSGSEDSTKPSVEKRDRHDRSPDIAQREGRKAFYQAWQGYMKTFTKTVSVIETARRPDLCSTITRSVVDTCKRGVRTQVAFCKQSLREKVDQCKRNVNDKIDQCKRKYRKYDPRKAGCEPRYRPETWKCEALRVDLPFCEFDRLTSPCCEAFRTQAEAMCSAGVSTASIQKQIQSIQTTCSIGTGLAKAATKSWLTGQALGVVTQLHSIKEIGDTVEAIQKVDQTRANMEKWAEGLAAAAQGNMAEAQGKLRSLLPQISVPIDNAANWAEAAQAVVEKNVDGALTKVANAAGEVQAIQSAKSTIKSLKTVADDVKAIQTAARQCAKVPKNITPEGYPGWKRATSKKNIDAAVAEYKRFFTKKLEAAAECKAVVVRAQRVIGK